MPNYYPKHLFFRWIVTRNMYKRNAREILSNQKKEDIVFSENIRNQYIKSQEWKCNTVSIKTLLSDILLWYIFLRISHQNLVVCKMWRCQIGMQGPRLCPEPRHFCKLDVANSRTTCHFNFKQLRALGSTKLHL